MEWLVVFVVSCGAALPSQAFSLSKGFHSGDTCAPLKQVLADSITAAGISFFADHPLGNRTFDPNAIEPFTPSGLFKTYYGEDASSAELMKAILIITYSAAEQISEPVDRNEQRRNLYKYIKAGSYEYSREKVGQLFRNIVQEFVKNSDLWAKNDCVENAALDNVLEAIEVECYRIRNEVGDVRFGQLMAFGVGSTLAFAIDDTGSMSGEIEAAKKRAQTIVEYTRGTLDAPQDFVLAPFNDPGVGPLTVTNNAVEYHDALGKLYAHGGGDGPELSMRGIQLAIEHSRPGSIVYVITDEVAKDFDLQDTVVAQARQKSIVVTFLLTNRIRSCPNGGHLRQYKTCMGLYQHIARETGGKILVVGRSDIFRATDIVQAYAKQGIVLLKRETVKGNSKEPHKIIHFFGDNALQEVLLEAQGSCENIYLSSPGSRDEHLKLKPQRYGDVWTVAVNLKNLTGRNPVGQWTLGFDVRTESCSVKIQAKATMGYVFTLFRKGKDEPNSNFKVLREDPFIEDTIGVVLDGYGIRSSFDGVAGDHATALKYVNERGKVMRTVSLAKVAGQTKTHIFQNDALQLEPFRLMVEGKDNEGNSFQRMHPSLITPSHVRIQCDLSDLIFVSGVEASANITIRNFGANDEFVLTTSDEFGATSFHGGAKSQSLKIQNNEVVTKKLRLLVEEKTKDGTAIKITITVKGKLPGSFQYSSCTLVVGQKKRPRIDSFSVKGTINARFAETVVTSVVTNNADIGREAEFDVLLPEEAFITGVRIELANETIHGVIEEKKKAEKIYERAKERGTIAGHVAAREKSTRSYRTSMFVEARQKIQFVLTYQQLLKRVRGRYEYAVILNPDQPIRSLIVDVHISEESRLSSVRVPPLKTTLANVVDPTPPGTTITYSSHNTAAHVHYQPNYEEQIKWSPKGLSGTFVVEYDVERPELSGQISVNNGYFAHFFAPPTLQPIPKIVVFVVDTSGSMYGYKMKQMKEALVSTLQSLNSGDKFGIVTFDDGASPWSNGTLLPATESNLNDVVQFVRNLKPFGGTNFEDAFQVLFDMMAPYLPKLKVEVEESSGEEGSALTPNVTLLNSDDEVSLDVAEEDKLEEEMMEPDEELDTFAEKYAKMAVFMTDGRPSMGETNTGSIRKSVKEKNGGRVVLHAVGIGSLVDFNFLQKLANENGGNARRIFEGIEADIQIRNFLEEVTNPILRDVTIDYPTERVEDLTVNEFAVFLGGTELVVAGRVRPVAEKLDSDIEDLELLGESLAAPSHGQLIPAQVRGTTFEDELEIGFDLDPNKRSKIMDSPHQIQNFTEKLWAFLRLKDLLLDASVEENKTKKQELNEEALNMSLRYEFVTPLTSMIVVRPDDKVALETELRKEEEEKRKAEAGRTTTMPYLTLPPPEAEYLEDIEEMRPDFALSCDGDCYDFDEPPPVMHYSRVAADLGRGTPTLRRKGRRRGKSRGGGGGGGGFSGDPHFIIPLQEDLNICFNWDGKDGEIYNLLYDPDKNIAVNGILENSPAPPSAGRVKRTYVSTLGITIPRHGKKITITPWNVTILERNVAVLSLPVSSRSSLSSEKGFRISVENITRSSSEVVIECDGLVFLIKLRRRTHSSYSRDHLDFSLLNDLRSLSRGSDGVFGQFASLYTNPRETSKLRLLGEGRPSGADGQIRNELYIRGKFIPVVKRVMSLPGREEETSCWYIHRNGVDSMRKSKAKFRQSSLLEIPSIL